MVIYVETNFVLELALRQEQAAFCRRILARCLGGQSRLVLPAFSLAEPFHAIVGRFKQRRQAAEGIRTQLRQLSRHETLAQEVEALQSVTAFLVRSEVEERKSLQVAVQEVVRIAGIIPLDASTLDEAFEVERTFKLSPQDSIVLASVLGHLQRERPEQSCFLNRNAKDFDDPDIVIRLEALGCKLLPRFDQGLEFIQRERRG
jgi:predicted nucleic acid-binding protein